MKARLRGDRFIILTGLLRSLVRDRSNRYRCLAANAIEYHSGFVFGNSFSHKSTQVHATRALVDVLVAVIVITKAVISICDLKQEMISS